HQLRCSIFPQRQLVNPSPATSNLLIGPDQNDGNDMLSPASPMTIVFGSIQIVQAVAVTSGKQTPSSPSIKTEILETIDHGNDNLNPFQIEQQPYPQQKSLAKEMPKSATYSDMKSSSDCKQHQLNLKTSGRCFFLTFDRYPRVRPISLWIKFGGHSSAISSTTSQLWQPSKKITAEQIRESDPIDHG
ncbi:hypothetical protein ACLOJK_036664, partial [Asimina triloba]